MYYPDLTNLKSKSTSPVMKRESSVGLREKIGFVISRGCGEEHRCAKRASTDPALWTGPFTFSIQLHLPDLLQERNAFQSKLCFLFYQPVPVLLSAVASCITM